MKSITINEIKTSLFYKEASFSVFIEFFSYSLGYVVYFLSDDNDKYYLYSSKGKLRYFKGIFHPRNIILDLQMYNGIRIKSISVDNRFISDSF